MRSDVDRTWHKCRPCNESFRRKSEIDEHKKSRRHRKVLRSLRIDSPRWRELVNGVRSLVTTNKRTIHG